MKIMNRLVLRHPNRCGYPPFEAVRKTGVLRVENSRFPNNQKPLQLSSDTEMINRGVYVLILRLVEPIKD